MKREFNRGSTIVESANYPMMFIRIPRGIDSDFYRDIVVRIIFSPRDDIDDGICVRLHTGFHRGGSDLNTFSLTLKKHGQLIVFILGLILVFWLLWALRGVLLPFIIGLVLAYLLLPFIRWIESHFVVKGKNRKLKATVRLLVIFLVYLLILVVIVLAMFYLVTFITKTMGNLTQDSAQIIPKAVNSIKQGIKSLPFLSDPSIQTKIDDYAAKAEAEAPGMINNFLSGGMKTMTSALGTIFSFVITPVFMLFILKDWERLRRDFYAMLPHWAREHTKNIFSILQEVLVAYIRGQMLQSIAVGICAFIILTILGIDLALPLALFAAIFEVVPTFGPLISGALAAIVTLVMDPDKVLYVILGYLLIQLLENNILVPRIQSSQMEIHPAFILIISILGAQFAGLVGFIIALPLTMTVIKIIEYLRQSVRQGYIS